MRCPAILTCLVLACWPTASAYAESITFEHEVVGLPPSDFDFWGTGESGPGSWDVVRDESADGWHALEQYGHEPLADRVPLAIYKPFSGDNLEVAIHFKVIAGRLDQSAGVAVRLTTPDDYYVARASVIAQDVRLYRVANGKFDELGRMPARVTPKEWHTLVVQAAGDRFLVAFDGRPILAATDATFRLPGKIALWTNADSITRFDHLEIRRLR